MRSDDEDGSSQTSHDPQDRVLPATPAPLPLGMTWTPLASPATAWTGYPTPGASYYSYYPYYPPIPPSPLISSGSMSVIRAASNKPSPSRDDLAIAFAGNLFDGLFTPAPPGRRSRAKFKWPRRQVTTEERLLVAFRALEMLGFPTIGAFISCVVGEKFSVHQEVVQTVASFVQSSENNTDNHPHRIVDMIYRHHQSQSYQNRRPDPPHYFSSLSCKEDT
ncbi:hypothetical protein BDZ89DRAFT_1203583 [Hymenopellis radicata]|nr:hypothetical protein BDZ89DRAFT_1203583 [Hymenopellis radicata]